MVSSSTQLFSIPSTPARKWDLAYITMLVITTLMIGGVAIYESSPGFLLINASTIINGSLMVNNSINSTGDICITGGGCLSNVTTSYFNSLTNFTGTLTDTKICTYDISGNTINCTSTATSGGGSRWTIDNDYLNNISDILTFNETLLNITIDARSVNSTGTNNTIPIMNENNTLIDSSIKKEGNTLIFKKNSSTSGTAFIVRNDGGVGGATFRFMDDVSGADWKFKSAGTGHFKIRDKTYSRDVMTLETNGVANTLYLASTGYVGIGTKNPNSTLTVIGEFNLTGISSDGTGKAVCIKLNGDLGTCTSTVSTGGACTCS